MESYTLDTPLDRLIHRPPARFFARLLSKTPVTPNQVTLLSLMPALLAALFLARGSALCAVGGVFFFYLWTVADHTDGELARRLKKSSSFGRALDDACDDAASTMMLVGIFVGAARRLPPGPRPLYLALFAGGIAANLSLGAATLALRRRSGTERKGRFLAFWSGREPFYLLLALAAACLAAGGNWIYVLLNTLMAGCYLVAACLWADARRSAGA